MKVDSKQYSRIPEDLLNKIIERGYKKVTPEDQKVFDKYYDEMNNHWSSSTCFVNLYAWHDTFPTYYKIFEDLIIAVNYDSTEGYISAIPFIGHYTEEEIIDAMKVLEADFEYFGEELMIYDVSRWMLPYYEATGIHFKVTDNREEMDYVFTPEDFMAGMDSQDDRYRYRYFMRRNEYEVVELTPELADECEEMMENLWCEFTDCNMCHYGCLKNVIDIIVKNIDTLNAEGILVRVDGKAVGLSIVSVRNGLGVYQYKNANNHIKGINEFLLRESFDRYMSDVTEINYTEDMGVESLRRYKEHMAPHYSLESKLILEV